MLCQLFVNLQGRSNDSRFILFSVFIFSCCSTLFSLEVGFNYEINICFPCLMEIYVREQTFY